jgi:hypothetical protein
MMKNRFLIFLFFALSSQAMQQNNIAESSLTLEHVTAWVYLKYSRMSSLPPLNNSQHLFIHHITQILDNIGTHSSYLNRLKIIHEKSPTALKTANAISRKGPLILLAATSRWGDRIDMLHFLIDDIGLDPNESYNGKPLLYWAIQNPDTRDESLSYLRQKTISPETVIDLLHKADKGFCIKKLLESGVEVKI